MNKYFSLQGRSTRSQYWAIQLLSIVIGFIWFLGLGAILLNIDNEAYDVLGGLMIMAGWAVIGWVHLATVVRRCRDIGISPWYTVTIYIPYLGFIPLIIIGCLTSDEN